MSQQASTAPSSQQSEPSPSKRPPLQGKREQPLIALIGNPNTGKTTLFNRLTGARARVGNYPGITVERRSGTLKLSEVKAELLDLPGTYSLCARSPDEQIALEAVVGLGAHQSPDLAIAVVDVGQLLRNLYLIVQLIELRVPLVVAVNMIDELESPPDCSVLEKAFGVPFVPLSARAGDGVERLREEVGRALASPPLGRADIRYDADIDTAAEALLRTLPPSWREDDARARALALWALCSVDEDDELRNIPATLREACLAQQQDHDIDGAVVGARYAFLDETIAPLLAPDEGEGEAGPAPLLKRQQWTERVDRVLLHPVWGFAVFVALMIVVFQALFSWSDPFIGLIEDAFGWLGELAAANLPEGAIANLISEGIIGGVGNVVVFLPQILLLFLLLGLLEDSGYMARAAYLMDRVMRAVGLHGRAFVPMLSGCACAIPAIMATRTMSRERDRLLTMLVIPLMTCSARLPVYTLIIAALFPPSDLFGVVPVQGLLMVFMYLFATLMTLLAAAVIGRTAVKGRRMPLLLELPPYRLPTLRSVLRQMIERAGVFLKEAGTVILACTILLWGLLSYPKPQAPQPLATQAVAGWQHSFPSSWSDTAKAEPTKSDAAKDADKSGNAIASNTTTPTWRDDGTLDADGMADNGDALTAWQSARLQQSYGGRLGKVIEPAIAPLGFDWKLGVGIIGAFAAREVFVSTMGLVYGIGDADEESQPLRDKIRAERHPDGRPIYTPLMGLSLLIFFALACQCMSTLAVVKRETRSYKWPAFLFGYMTALAWLCSFLVYQGGKLLGFS